MKKKLLAFGIVSMFLLTSFVTLPSFGVTTRENANENLNYFLSINIEDNKDFTINNGVTNPDAKGTEEDPYIISDLEVQYILISNTDKYFEIKNSIFNVRGIGVSLIDVSNGMIKDCQFNNIENGVDIFLGNSRNNIIENCITSYNNYNEGNYFFFLGYKSDSNEIHNCRASAGDGNIDLSGFILSECNNNIIYNCEISGGTYGIAIEKSCNNIIHHNEIFNNDINAEVLSGNNQWDDGLGEGNYWDKYRGKDVDEDGIGDESLIISNDNQDRYPLLMAGSELKSTENLQSDEIAGECSTVTHTTSSSYGGWIEDQDGVTVLHLNGSYYEMGYQHGYLLKDKIQKNLRAQLTYFKEHSWPYERILDTWNVTKDYLPQCYKDEMQGMADGSGLPFNDIAVLNTIPLIFNHCGDGGKSCCEVALWGPITTDGKLYHIRGWDWRLDIKDPETGTFFQDLQILIVRDPDGGYASFYPEFAGDIFSWEGINEKGIAIGETSCSTDDYSYEGISSAFRMRMVLDTASTGQEAIDIMSSHRTDGWNFVISDGNVPEGFAMEQTKNISYAGKWNDPIEGTTPFWQVEGLVRRVPFFINPDTAATERDLYNPSGIKGFILFLLGKNGAYGLWTFYRVISQAAEKRAGTLDLTSTMNMIRDIYKGKTDLFFFVIQKIGFVYSVHQWVACPETGDLAIAFAKGNVFAFKNPVHYFNLYDELSESPPPNQSNQQNICQSSTTATTMTTATTTSTITSTINTVIQGNLRSIKGSTSR